MGVKFWKKQPDFAKQLGMSPPEPASDRAGLAMVFIAHNEAEYIEEWLRYYQMVGVDFFIGYNDGSTDGTFEKFADLVPPEKRVILPWQNRDLHDPRRGRFINNQVLAYFHAVGNFGSRFRWMTFIDLDEYIIPKKADTIEEALKPLDGFPNISLPWHMFGHSGHEERPEGGILKNYTMRARDPMSDLAGVRNFKCIVDPCQVSEVSIHGFKTVSHGDQTANDTGTIRTLEGRLERDFYSAENLQLNHYYTKSKAELAAKLERGSASPVNKKIHQDRVRLAVDNIEGDMVEDRAMIEFLERRGW